MCRSFVSTSPFYLILAKRQARRCSVDATFNLSLFPSIHGYRKGSSQALRHALHNTRESPLRRDQPGLHLSDLILRSNTMSRRSVWSPKSLLNSSIAGFSIPTLGTNDVDLPRAARSILKGLGQAI